MTRSSPRALACILVLAACFRLWGTFENPSKTEDEPLHVPSAISLGTYGTTTSMSWIHPPLSGLMLFGSISILGDNPYGWRINDVLFGTASVVLVYLIALRLFPGGAIPLIAAALLALDPFHAYFSRTTFVEIPATFFFLLYLYLMLEHCERGRRTLPLAGIALGLTIATKAYFVLAIPLVAGYALYTARRRGEPVGLLFGDYLVTHLLLPGSILLFSYVRWFGRGFTLPEFVRMNLDAVRTLRSYRIEEFLDRALLDAGGRPWEWFLEPIVFGRRELLGDGSMGRFVLEINNPPFRLLVIPALVLVGFHAWKERSARELLVPLLFAAVYALFLGAGRPMFSYSALTVLPFAYLALARAVVLAGGWVRRENQIVVAFLGCVVLWGIYTFPLISARPVPVALYRPLLAITTIVGGG